MGLVQIQIGLVFWRKGTKRPWIQLHSPAKQSPSRPHVSDLRTNLTRGPLDTPPVQGRAGPSSGAGVHSVCVHDNCFHSPKRNPFHSYGIRTGLR